MGKIVTVKIQLRFAGVAAFCLLLLANALLSDAAVAQQRDVPTISQYAPQSKLKVKQTLVRQARFTAVDIHTHLGFRLKHDAAALDRYVEVMDRQNIAISISLDAKLGNESAHLKFLRPHGYRFKSFAHIDFIGDGDRDQPATWVCNQPGFVRLTCEQLKTASSKGICGLKFFKTFGLRVKKPDGTLHKIDDPIWFPIWKTCGDLGLPIIMHTADPIAFFDPVDSRNERFEELLRHPDWSFHGDAFPSRQSLLEDRNRVIEKFSETRFVGAHVANSSEDLATVGQWLDRYPNLTVEIASRISELGRQPFTAKAFFEKYQDRILFGTDGPWDEVRLGYYWRFLQTNDEYFPYSEKQPPPQGLWNIYGVQLPDSVLEKIYFRNAVKLIPGLKVAYRSYLLRPGVTGGQ